ncbi:hypothetical protein M413DRAFT_449880 [Hebeloma cylindrosporum]|uniref:Mid2 domain-containing protein n=1 Tax=Hebeloma cylindrosporum TaxID=76867 RepID=A0A0C3BSY5_HEBCY|nr:hypothetical protein M413DRAFT_449880 [Hebeloma cylindrosporum h7]
MSPSAVRINTLPASWLPLLTSLYLSSLLPSSRAYSWAFQSTPQQCSNLTVTVSGSDGKPPYRILILPFGPTPLANNIEARTILDIPFNGQESSVSFKLKYPENSQFVAVVSDSTGFGSGGTSVAAQVTNSNDASCFDAKTNVSPDFYFSIEPPNQIVQCTDTRLWWDKSVVQGTPNFLGVIPGGQSFAIPQGTITDVTSQGTGFTWKPSLRGGTTLIIVGGDNRGNGTAGSTLNVVSSGVNNDGSCLSNSSPSSTPGSPAGGSYPTGTGSSSNNSSSSSGGSNVGAIVGGIIGGLALLIILLVLLWFFRRKSKQQKRFKERPVDLMNEEYEDGDEPSHVNNGIGGGAAGSVRRNELPQYYQPEPFMVPDPTLTMDSYSVTNTGTDDIEARRPLSGATSSFYTRATTPDGVGIGGSGVSGSGYERRKGGPPRAMRAVNIIQHDDAGPSLPSPEGDKDGEEPVTIELPPAYTALGRGGGAGAAAGAGTTGAGAGAGAGAGH